MNQEVLHCWSCNTELDIDSDFDPEDDANLVCDHCQETCVVVGTRTMSKDEAYEARCENQESLRYEEVAYGRHDEESDVPDTHTFHEPN
jgi:hypothetical protein